MKKISIFIIILLFCVNIATAFYCNRNIKVDTIEDKTNLLLSENLTGYFGRDFQPENYIIERVNHNGQKALEQLMLESTIIVKGRLISREQNTDLIQSCISVSEVYKGDYDSTSIYITELYWIDNYDYEGVMPIGLLDPFYCPVLEDKEYIFFLKEIYPNMYSYTDKLFTKIPVTNFINIGRYFEEGNVHTFDAATFFSSDILHPLNYKQFYLNENEYDSENKVDYTKMYLEFCEGGKVFFRNK